MWLAWMSWSRVLADGVGKHLRLLFRTRLPYTLG